LRAGRAIAERFCGSIMSSPKLPRNADKQTSSRSEEHIQEARKWENQLTCEPQSNLIRTSNWYPYFQEARKWENQLTCEPQSNLIRTSNWYPYFAKLEQSSQLRSGFENRFEICIYPLEDLKRCMFVSFMKNSKLYYYTDSRKFVKNCCQKRPT